MSSSRSHEQFLQRRTAATRDPPADSTVGAPPSRPPVSAAVALDRSAGVDGRERIVRRAADALIPGTLLEAFIHNGDYHLTPIKVYQDGMIDCWELVDFETFRQKVAQGWVVTRVPAGARVRIHDLAAFTVSD